MTEPYESLAKVVDRLVDNRVTKAPFDKTYAGIISAILFEPDTDRKDQKFGTYKIRYGAGAEREIKLTDGIVHEVGERVNVYMPENNPNRAIVEPVITNKKPNKVVYDKENNKFIEHRETSTDEKTYDIENEYTITLQEQDGKEVTVIQHPDKRETVLENFGEYEEWFSEIDISDTELNFTSGNRTVYNPSTKKSNPKIYKYELHRDDNGRIAQITDVYGNVTKITRS